MRLAPGSVPPWQIIDNFHVSYRPEAEVIFDPDDVAFGASVRAKGEALRRLCRQSRFGLNVAVKIRGEHVYLVRR